MFTASQLEVINQLLVNEPTSRKRLAQRLTLTTAAITIIVNQLIEKGIVYEVKDLDLGKVGRREMLLDVVEDAFFALGLDVEAERIHFSLTNLKGKIIDTRSFKSFDDAMLHIQDLKTRKSNLLGITVMLRGYVNESTYFYHDKNIKAKLEALKLPYKLINNVSALAILHRFYNFKDENFLLVKYGPGLGSAIMVNGGLVMQKTNTHSEMGQMILDLKNHKPLEDCIKYAAFDENMTDDGVVTYFMENPSDLEYLINCLSVSIINSHVLLSLDKVIIAGTLFTEDVIFNQLIEAIQKINPLLPSEDIIRIPDYGEKSRKLGSIVTIYAYFNGLIALE